MTARSERIQRILSLIDADRTEHTIPQQDLTFLENLIAQLQDRADQVAVEIQQLEEDA